MNKHREKLREYRLVLKLTQLEMAEKLGISKSMYQAIELGTKSPSFETLQKFKNAYPMVNLETIFF